MKDVKDIKLIEISDEAYNKALEAYPVDMQKYNGIEVEYDSNMGSRMLWAAGYDAALKEHNLV